MFTLRNDLEINRPVAQVFDFIANVENAPKWQPAVIETRRITAGPLRVGTQFKEVAKMMGRRVNAMCEITEMDPSRRLAFRGGEPRTCEYHTTYTFESRGPSTRITIDGTFVLKGWWRILEPLARVEMRKESAGELVAMKNAIESASK